MNDAPEASSAEREPSPSGRPDPGSDAPNDPGTLPPPSPWGPVLYALGVFVAAGALYAVVMRSVEPAGPSALHLDGAPVHTRRVAYLTWGRDPVLDSVEAGVVARLEARGMEHVELVRGTAGHDPRGVAPMVRDVLATPQIELVIAVTTPVARAAADQVQELPVVFAAVSDPVAAGLVPRAEGPPGGEVTGVAAGCSAEAGLDLISALAPGRRVGLFHDANLALLAPLPTATAEARGVELVPLLAPGRAAIEPGLLGAVDAGVSALWVHSEWASPQVTGDGFEDVVRFARARGWPVFASDAEQLPRGATAALGPDWHAVGRSAADAAIAILQGTAPGEVPVSAFGCAPPIVHRERASHLELSLDAVTDARLVD